MVISFIQRNHLYFTTYSAIISLQKESTHSKVDAPEVDYLSLRTPPILLADRIGIFIFARFSYQEKQATRLTNYRRTLAMLISR